MDSMQQQMTGYFGAEKWESVLFVLVGAVAIAASIGMWRSGAALRGMGYPLVLVGLAMIGVGGSILARTDKQVAALTVQLRTSPAAFKAAEVPRMQKVQQGFATLKYAEIALLLVGLGLALLMRQSDLWYGVAIGLVLMSSIALVMDLIAEHRGARYLEQVLALQL